MVNYSCTSDQFIPSVCHGVDWLAQAASYDQARGYWAVFEQPLMLSTWESAHRYGYEYAALRVGGRLACMAAVWRFSPAAWDMASVSTLPEHRLCGYSKQVISFVTSAILRSGRLAPCTTMETNRGMTAAALSIGYRIVPLEQVWWTYPDPPGFKG